MSREQGTQTLASACPLDCPDTCTLAVDVVDGRVTSLTGTDTNPLTAGFICSKVKNFARHMYGSARLQQPLARVGPKGSASFEPVTWDEALDRITNELRRARDTYGGASILPFCYGGSNGYLSQNGVDARLFRRLGASRIDRTFCAAPATAATKGVYGSMPGVALEDFIHAKLIVVWGCNPSSTGIHLVPVIKEAQRRGAKVVVIDPRRIPIAKTADLHLPIRPGTDLPIALAIIHRLVSVGAADQRFLSEHTTGAAKLFDKAAAWSLTKAADTSGVRVEDLEQLVEWLGQVRPGVIRLGLGPERNRNGGSAIAAILAIPAVAGLFGVRGGGFTLANSGAFSVSAEPSVQEPERPTRKLNMNRLGWALQNLEDPPIKALFVYNCNPVATAPHQGSVRTGLTREDLFTVVFDQVLTDTARYADVVLPATTFLEHRELRRGYGAMVLCDSPPVVEPFGEARSNLEVFAELCRRLELHQVGDLEDADDLVATILDGGRAPDQLRSALAASNVASPTGPGGSRPVLFVDIFPGTGDRKADLHPASLDEASTHGLFAYQEDPSTERHPLALISPSTNRTISSTFGQLGPTQVDALMNPLDASNRGIADGDQIRIFNALGEVRCGVRVSEDVRPTVVVLPKGLWLEQTDSDSTSNALVPDTLEDLAGGACYNDARVEVERLAVEPSVVEPG